MNFHVLRVAGCFLLLLGFEVRAAGDLQSTINQFRADDNVVSRAYHLPWSTQQFARVEVLNRDWQERLPRLDFDALNQHGRIDYLLLRNKLASEQDHLKLQRERLAEMDELLSFRSAIQQLEAARWRMERVDAPAAASQIVQVAERARQLKERAEKGKKARDEKKSEKASETSSGEADENKPLHISPAIARRAATAIQEIRNSMKTWFTFYDGYQPDFTWWLKKPYEEANTALEAYAKYLREEIAGIKGKDEDPLVGDPIGRDALLRSLEVEMIPYTPEELIQIGEKEFAWCEAEMKKAAKELSFDDWKKALAEVKSRYVPPGQQDAFVMQVAREAIDFVKTNHLVTVTPLCEEVWRLSMISPEGQKTMPYVAYGGLAMLVAYAKDEMKHEDKLMSMRGNNRHFTRITTAHELIPGHHLQIFTAQRHRQYRSLFNTPFLTEGWPLYWELRLWELGYGKTPEDRIGMLFWRMHRAARIIVSLKFHLGEMQPKEMVDFLVQRVGHEKLGATSEVRRYIAGDYSPLYQCGYLLGGLQLRALHRELVGAGKMSEKEFNDTVLTYNSIPVELIRAGMLNLPLARDTKASWRFYDQN